MADILIRGVPDDVVVAIDTGARSAGLSRSEYLRRILARERHGDASDVTVDHLVAFADTFAELADAEVMDDAWR